MSQSPPSLELDYREVPAARDDLIIPFQFLHEPHLMASFLGHAADLISKIIFGRDELLDPPYDPFTTWATIAHLGGIEKDGLFFKPEFDRERRLKIASRVLSPGELLYVESIAIPKQYREMRYEQLLELIYSDGDYRDGMWAACWLIRLGCERHSDWPFTDTGSDEYPQGELVERIVRRYARSVGVTDPNDELGWRRIDESYQGNVIGSRFSICAVHYSFNGPPPYKCMRNTISQGPGWKMLDRLVPEHPSA